MKSIIALAKHPDIAHRLEAIQQLEQLGTPLAAEWLAWLLWDMEQEVRAAAAWALVRLDEAAVAGLLVVLNQRFRSWDVGRALGEIGVPAMKLLLIAARHPNGRIRYAAAYGLSAVGLPAVEPLLEILADAKHFGQDAAAIALGDIGDQRVVEPLIAQVEKTTGMTQYRIIEALGRLGDARAIEALTSIIRQSGGSNIWRAESALKEIGTPEAIAAIQQRRDEIDAYYRELRAKNARPKRDLPIIHPDQPE